MNHNLKKVAFEKCDMYLLNSNNRKRQDYGRIMRYSQNEDHVQDPKYIRKRTKNSTAGHRCVNNFERRFTQQNVVGKFLKW